VRVTVYRYDDNDDVGFEVVITRSGMTLVSVTGSTDFCNAV